MATRRMREWSCDGSAVARCPNRRSVSAILHLKIEIKRVETLEIDREKAGCIHFAIGIAKRVKTGELRRKRKGWHARNSAERVRRSIGAHLRCSDTC